MCIVSMVHDHYDPQIPDWRSIGQMWPTSPQPMPTTDLDRFERLIREFREAIEAAKKLDVIMKLPDCVDPEKAKLQDRVNELESQLAKIREAANGQ